MNIAYVNGRYVEKRDAFVHVEDRGFQFSDGVYEVIAVYERALVDGVAHMERLHRSLEGLGISMPCSENALSIILAEVIRRNRLQFGALYLQVTRGVAPRNHAFPHIDTKPSLIITPIRGKKPGQGPPRGVAVITRAENRWSRPDIKSVSLLPNVLAKEEAVRAEAFEAWFVDKDGDVTEGSSSNAWIVEGGRIITRALGQDILGGITRARILVLAEENGLEVGEETFDVDRALAADEAFVTSTTACVVPVVTIDGKQVGQGAPGPVTLQLAALYRSYMATAPGQG